MTTKAKGFQIIGLPQLQKEAERCARDLMEAEQPAAMAAGEPIRAKWVGLVPILDGNYRESLVVAWTGVKGAAVGTRWVPGLDRDEQPFTYSKLLEFGDSDRAAKPSARPAQQAARAEALAAGAVPLRSVVKGRKPRMRLPGV